MSIRSTFHRQRYLAAISLVSFLCLCASRSWSSANTDAATLGEFPARFAQRLTSAQDATRITAMTELSNSAYDRRAVPLLIAALGDANETMVLLGAVSLSNARDPRALSPLCDVLAHHAVAPCRGRAAFALGWLGDEQAVAPLSDAVMAEQNTAARIQMIAALGQIAGASAARTLQRTLLDENPVIRQASIEAVGAMRSSEATMALLPQLHDSDVQVRVAACRALGVSTDIRVVRHIVPMLNDPSALVRVSSALSLGNLRDTQARIPLRQAITHDTATAVKAAACYALGLVGDQRDVPLLLTKTSDDNSIIRQAAIRALGILGDARAVPRLSVLCATGLPHLRIEALQAISSCPAETRIGQTLSAALSDPFPPVRMAAVQALVAEGTPEATALLLATAQHHHDAMVRDIALFSLIDLHPAQAVTYLAAVAGDRTRISWLPAACALYELRDPRGSALLAAAWSETLPVSTRIEVAARLAAADTTGAMRDDLRAALHDERIDIRISCIRDLKYCAANDRKDLLLTAFTDPDNRVREAAVTAVDADCTVLIPQISGMIDEVEPVGSAAIQKLGVLHATQFVTRMKEIAQHDAVRSRRIAAIEALGYIGDPTTLGIVQALSHEDAIPVRRQALSALQQMGGPQATERLLEALHDPSFLIRQTAVTALQGMGSDSRIIAERLRQFSQQETCQAVKRL